LALAMLAGTIGWIVRDRADRLADIDLHAAEAIAGGRTAIEAGDLALARRRVAEAQAILGAERTSFPGRVLEADRLELEVEARQGDEHRFLEFVKVTNDALDKMSQSRQLSAFESANKALDLFGVLSADDWLPQLEKAYLTAEQKQQVRESAYLTL